MWAKKKKSLRLGVLITQTKWRLRSVAVFVRAMIVKGNNKDFIFIANVHIIYQCFRIFSLILSVFVSLLMETLKLISIGITANIFFYLWNNKFYSDVFILNSILSRFTPEYTVNCFKISAFYKMKGFRQPSLVYHRDRTQFLIMTDNK